ncbi:hypothetical protein O7621_12110 [Solwaraspora sp. WMMD937]|uniref:hypothetical protein n=1 Tax=Solwaraspora sp. WMMD937 TaxID=3016090 RepID=UPI00249CCA31|nr:hypothetical protein [Solwaraspora sp. WMMD937]WFE23944.1 hypothetical protein O7621_12110 [Solwaraspora sp. WMMD937]
MPPRGRRTGLAVSTVPICDPEGTRTMKAIRRRTTSLARIATVGLIAAVATGTLATTASADTVTVANAGFESGYFDDWRIINSRKVALSDIGNTGHHSAKIQGTGGEVRQEVTVTPGTDYTLTAYVRGKGAIGARVGGDTYTSSGGGRGFEPVSVDFNTGSASTVEIFAAYGGKTGRFDDFTLSTGPAPGAGFDPSVWDSSEAGDYIKSSDPYVLSFDGLEQFTVTGSGGGPRDELKTPVAARKASDEIYESFSADIRFDLDDGVKLIAHQIHAGTGAGFSTQVKLYVQDSSPLGIFKGEGEQDFSIDDYPLLEGVPSNGVFDVYVRVQIPGFVSGDGQINEEIFDLGTVRSGETMRYEFINDYGVVTVDSTIGRTSTSFTYDMQDSQASYMKFGSYVQAQDAESGCNVTNDLDCEYPGWVPYGEASSPAEAEVLWRRYFADSGISKARVTFSNVVHTGGPLQ